jgi:hypothetical protein
MLGYDNRHRPSPYMSRTRAAAAKPVDFKRIFGVVLGIAALVWWSLDRAEYFISRSILVAYGDMEATFRGAWFEWDGDLYAKDFRILDDETGEVLVRADYVVAETPGWHWVIPNLILRKRTHRIRIDRIRLALLNVEQHEEHTDPTLGDLGPVSVDNASPFDAEGCSNTLSWRRFELADLGLVAGPSEVRFDYDINGEDLDVEIRLEVPGVSRTRVTRKEQMLGGSNALVLDHMQTQVLSERFEVEDLGFVAARNRHCAELAGIDEASFVRRHIESIERVFAHEGFGVSAQAMAGYGDFARNGGSFVIDLAYSPPLYSNEFYEQRLSSEVLPRLQAHFERSGRSYPLEPGLRTERPLADYDSRVATWTLIERERAAQGRRASATTATADASLPEAPTTTVAAVTPPASIAVSPPTSALASPSARPAVAAAVDSNDDWAPDVIEQPDRLQWEALTGMVGERVRVWTRHSGPRVVELLAINGDQLQVRAQMGGGAAEFRIRREAFLYAKRL